MKYKFKTEPWEHQRECLRQTWNKPFAALLLDYGVGKTKIIIDNAGILFERKQIQGLFVIAPNEVHQQWVNEQVPSHLPDRIKRIARAWSTNTSQKFKRTLEEFWNPKYDLHLRVFTMNVESLQSSVRAQAFAKNFLKQFRCMLVIDESSRVKSPGAKRAKFIVNQLSPLAPYRRTLTGNEITRSPFDVYMPYRFLHADFWNPIPNYHIFTHRYGEWKKNFRFMKSIKVKGYVCSECQSDLPSIAIKRAMGTVFAVCPKCSQVLKAGSVPKKVKNLLDNDGKFEFPTLLKYKNLDELRKKTAAHSFQVRKEDCMDLPEKIYSPIYAEMNEDQKRLYRELKDRLYTEYNGEELTVQNKIALTTRFQQIVGGFFPESEEQIGENNPKMDRLFYDLEDIDTDAPIIIWARFTVEIRKIAQRLKQVYPDKVTEMFYGDTAKPDRRRIIDDFKAGKVGFFVANTMTAGTGLNLQNSYIQYYYSNSFNAEDRWQSEDRSHRGGQTHNCLYKDIYIKGSVDDTIRKANETKVNLAEFFKDHSVEELV